MLPSFQSSFSSFKLCSLTHLCASLLTFLCRTPFLCVWNPCPPLSVTWVCKSMILVITAADSRSVMLKTHSEELPSGMFLRLCVMQISSKSSFWAIYWKSFPVRKVSCFFVNFFFFFQGAPWETLPSLGSVMCDSVPLRRSCIHLASLACVNRPAINIMQPAEEWVCLPESLKRGPTVVVRLGCFVYQNLLFTVHTTDLDASNVVTLISKVQ